MLIFANEYSFGNKIYSLVFRINSFPLHIKARHFRIRLPCKTINWLSFDHFFVEGQPFRSGYF